MRSRIEQEQRTSKYCANFGMDGAIGTSKNNRKAYGEIVSVNYSKCSKTFGRHCQMKRRRSNSNMACECLQHVITKTIAAQYCE